MSHSFRISFVNQTFNSSAKWKDGYMKMKTNCVSSDPHNERIQRIVAQAFSQHVHVSLLVSAHENVACIIV